MTLSSNGQKEASSNATFGAGLSSVPSMGMTTMIAERSGRNENSVKKAVVHRSRSKKAPAKNNTVEGKEPKERTIPTSAVSNDPPGYSLQARMRDSKGSRSKSRAAPIAAARLSSSDSNAIRRIAHTQKNDQDSTIITDSTVGRRVAARDSRGGPATRRDLLRKVNTESRLLVLDDVIYEHTNRDEDCTTSKASDTISSQLSGSTVSSSSKNSGAILLKNGSSSYKIDTSHNALVVGGATTNREVKIDSTARKIHSTNTSTESRRILIKDDAMQDGTNGKVAAMISRKTVNSSLKTEKFRTDKKRYSGSATADNTTAVGSLKQSLVRKSSSGSNPYDYYSCNESTTPQSLSSSTSPTYRDCVRRDIDYNEVIGTFAIPTFKLDENQGDSDGNDGKSSSYKRDDDSNNDLTIVSLQKYNGKGKPMYRRSDVIASSLNDATDRIRDGKDGERQQNPNRRQSEGKCRTKKKIALTLDWSDDEEDWMEQALLNVVPAAYIGSSDASGTNKIVAVDADDDQQKIHERSRVNRVWPENSHNHTSKQEQRQHQGGKRASFMSTSTSNSLLRNNNNPCVEPKRRSIGDLSQTGSEFSLRNFLANHYTQLQKDQQINLPQNRPDPPPNALSNIPVLPIIKTYKATKRQSDEPTGLFLVKAKNGAVVVHSISPDSLFRRTFLLPGQEILSVNEKRVNDPKMAATLITQAKGRLALRVSTAERPRGFQYCQVKRKGDGGGKVGTKTSHGLRFVTTSLDGVRRGNPVRDGLVRISHIDPHGLFAKAHPLNRVRVGSIILSVNGTPVTNSRLALEKIMLSRQLIEVLHCDERVWRESWVWDSLREIKGEKKKILNGVVASMFWRDDSMGTNEISERLESIKHDWDTEWKSERDEVILRRNGSKWSFKLVFDNNAGTCYSENVQNEMMPPTDEFDVSFLVEIVNEKQKTVMQLLQNMLGRAKFELKFGSGTTQYKEHSQLIPVRGHISKTEAKPYEQKCDSDTIRVQSFDALSTLVNYQHGMNEEMSALIDNFSKADDKGHLLARNRDPPQFLNRTGSTGAPQIFDEAEKCSSYFMDIWDLKNVGKVELSTNKIREFSSRQKIFEELKNRQLDGENPLMPCLNRTKDSITSSLFSVDMLEDYKLDQTFNGDNSQSFRGIEIAESSQFTESPSSPRSDNNVLDNNLQILPRKVSNEMVDAPADEDNGHGDWAYVTGVIRDIHSKYEISDNIIGSGGFGEVRECTEKSSELVYVVKTISKPSADDTTKINLIRNEILLLHEVNHPNIVELKDLFEDKKYVHIIMERCTGGDLFDRVVSENPHRIRRSSDATKHEARTANIMRSILKVIRYLHSKNIVHRDIKPEHFLLSSTKRENQKIKLIDFGLARKHKPGSAPMTTFTGSPNFVAPEIIARSYDHRCDIFSTGVTAFFLLTGMLPFEGPTDEDTFNLITTGIFKFPSSAIHLSDNARDFVTSLLKTNPDRRITVDGALKHPWLKKDACC